MQIQSEPLIHKELFQNNKVRCKMGRLTMRGTPLLDGEKIREHASDLYWALKHYEDLEEQGRLIEQKHGMWIRTGAISYRCSECNYLPLENDTAFCPNCGAKMELKELER